MQNINPSPPPAADPDALLPPIELREYLFVIFRHWRVIAVMVFVAALVSTSAGVFGAKTYSAVATIANTAGSISPQQVLAAGVSDETLNQLALTELFNHMQRPMQPLNAADLRRKVQITSADSVVFSIAARDSSAAGAALLANTLAELMVRHHHHPSHLRRAHHPYHRRRQPEDDQPDGFRAGAHDQAGGGLLLLLEFGQPLVIPPRLFLFLPVLRRLCVSPRIE